MKIFTDEIDSRAELFVNDNFSNPTDNVRLIVKTAMLIGASITVEYNSNCSNISSKISEISIDGRKRCYYELGVYCPYDVVNEAICDSCIACGRLGD